MTAEPTVRIDVSFAADPKESDQGHAYFARAHKSAGEGKYDESIDWFIQGLYCEPTNMAERGELRRVALKRKMSGGKHLGAMAGRLLGAKVFFKGSSAKERMLNAEWLLARDPDNIDLMLTIVREAMEADYKKIVSCFAAVVMLATKEQNKPDIKIYAELADIYQRCGELVNAAEAAGAALELTPKDPKIVAHLKELRAGEKPQPVEEKLLTSISEPPAASDESVDLLQIEKVSKSEEFKSNLILQTRKAWLENPGDTHLLAEYAQALIDMETEENEKLAIEILEKAYEQTAKYRYRVLIGDLRIKQNERKYRALKQQHLANRHDAELAKQFTEVERERVEFALHEFRQRMEHSPEDNQVHFKYGFWLFRAKHFGAAINVLYRVRKDPHCRTNALLLMGRAFLEKSSAEKAADTLRRAVDSYPHADTGDADSKELHYWLGRALEACDKVKEADKVFSRIIRWDIRYCDTRKRLNNLRARKSEPPVSNATVPDVVATKASA